MANQPCVIGKSVGIRGHVAGGEDLAVEGRIEGTIALTGRLAVEASGIVEADVEADQLEIRGTLRGDARCAQSVVLRAGGQMVGAIQAAGVVIEDGAQYSGRIEMEIELPAGVKPRS